MYELQSFYIKLITFAKKGKCNYNLIIYYGLFDFLFVVARQKDKLHGKSVILCVRKKRYMRNCEKNHNLQQF